MNGLSLEEFKVFHRKGVQLIDSRPTGNFAASFIPNSINASLNGSYEYMASCIFDKEKHLIVICDTGREGESTLRLESEGFKDISSFKFSLWEGPTSSIERVDATEAINFMDVMKDVSNAEDWEVLHVKGVGNHPLVDLVDDYRFVKDNDVLYCGNGHKSMAAASLLMKNGIVAKDIIGGLSAMLVDAPELEI